MHKDYITFNEGIPTKNYIVLGILYIKLFLLIPIVKTFIYKKFLINCTECTITQGFLAFYGYNIFAKNVVLNDTLFLDYAPIYIGENTKFSLQNLVITGSHKKTNFDIVTAKPVSIGKNCWITSRCIILPGVTIGDNVIVGAGSVVSENIPSNCLVMGNPAKIVKYLDEQISS
jgi:maltose O-acetyltransferase